MHPILLVTSIFVITQHILLFKLFQLQIAFASGLIKPGLFVADERKEEKQCINDVVSIVFHDWDIFSANYKTDKLLKIAIFLFKLCAIIINFQHIICTCITHLAIHFNSHLEKSSLNTFVQAHGLYELPGPSSTLKTLINYNFDLSSHLPHRLCN